MMLLPEKKICYLMPLTEEVPTPAKLESDLDRTEVRHVPFFRQTTPRDCFQNIIRWQRNKTVTKFPNLSFFSKKHNCC